MIAWSREFPHLPPTGRSCLCQKAPPCGMRRSRPTWSRRMRTAASITENRSWSDAGSEQAVYTLHVAAGDVQRLVMLADRLLIRAFQEAIDLAVGVLQKLNLPLTELVRSAVPRSLGYLVDGFLRQLQVLVEIHESRHVVLPRHESSHYCAPATGALSIPGVIASARRDAV